MVYGVLTALVAAGLISFQPTEFGIKLAILSSLTVSCALVPLVECATRRSNRSAVNAHEAGEADPLSEPRWLSWRLLMRRSVGAVRRTAVAAAVIVALAAPLNTAVLAGNDDVMLLERGLTGEANAQ